MRSLRNTIKACEARIDEISDAATNEAVAILAEHNLDRGEFRDPDDQGGGSMENIENIRNEKSST